MNPTWMDNIGSTGSGKSGIFRSTTLSLTITGVTCYQAGDWTYTVENYLGSNKAEVLMFSYRLPQGHHAKFISSAALHNNVKLTGHNKSHYTP